MDPVVSAEHLRALRYIALVERGGGRLLDSQIDLYIETEPPSQDTWAVAWHTSRMSRLLVRGGYGLSTHADFMESLGWIRPEKWDGPRLSSIGHAIVRASEEADVAEPEGVVLLSPDDPLNLGVLTAEVAAAKGGALVDPYFDDRLVAWLANSTSIARVLMCRSVEACDALSYYLGGLERAGRKIDFRILPRGSLHDRYLIGEDGKVSMIGASLNGLHRNFTAIIEVPEPGAAAIRGEVDRKWGDALPVTPVADIKAPLPQPHAKEKAVPTQEESPEPRVPNAEGAEPK